jgi:pimeloyl-ACP methyl ester carboxylesterase
MPTAASNGIEIDYESHGQGEPLVLIMGFGAQRIMWPRELVEQLVQAGFQVITFDNRDVGKSTKLNHLGVPDVRKTLVKSLLGMPVNGPYRIADMARDVVGLLDALDIERAHVAGASMGGMIAQELAIAHGPRLLTMTSIMSSPGGRRYSVGRPEAIGRLVDKPAKSREEHADKLVQTFRVLSGKGFPFDAARTHGLGLEAWDRGVFPAGAARQFGAVLDSTSDRRARLQHVRVPSLVLHGTDDPLIPERAGKATARLIPGARYMPIPGMGHSFPVSAMPVLGGAIHSHVLAHRS